MGNLNGFLCATDSFPNIIANLFASTDHFQNPWTLGLDYITLEQVTVFYLIYPLGFDEQR